MWHDRFIISLFLTYLVNHLRKTCLNPSRSTFNDTHRRALWPLWFSATATNNLMGGLLARPACEAAVAGFPYDECMHHRTVIFEVWRFGTCNMQFETCKRVAQKVLLFGNCNHQFILKQKTNIVWTNFAQKTWSNPKHWRYGQIGVRP